MIKPMTIRRDCGNRKLSTKPEPDTLSDERTRFIVDNMTARHARILNDLSAGRKHSSPTCVCWLCLWRKYEKTKKPIGHPYDHLTFLAYDILSEVIDEFQYEPVKKIPIKKLAKEVIGRLPHLGEITKKTLIEWQKEQFEIRFPKYNRQKRYQSERLLNLREQLMYQIHREAGRKPPGLEPPKSLWVNWNKRPKRVPLPTKIAKFIYAQLNHQATQRQIQRHTNKSKAELEALHEWLKWRYGIIVPRRKKWESILYVGTKRKFPVRGPAPRRRGP